MSLLLALTGSAGPTNYTLTCSAGAYAVAGQSANVLRSKLVTGLAGSYTVAGQPAGITYTPVAGAYTITALAGSYSVSGKPATITKSGSQAVETYSGGYYPITRRKTKKEVYAERLKMGIVKEDIQKKAVEVVAKVAEKVNYAPAYYYDPDKLVKQLMAELRVKVPSPDYTRAIELALKIAEQDEEDALLLLAY